MKHHPGILAGCLLACAPTACRSSATAAPSADLPNDASSEAPPDVEVPPDVEAPTDAEHVESSPERGPLFPWSPVPGEKKIEHPCGPGGGLRCIVVMDGFANWAWGYRHSLWFLTADGRQYEYRFPHDTKPRGFNPDAELPIVPPRPPPPRDPPKTRPEDADMARTIVADGSVTAAELALLVKASQLLPTRVSEADVEHALVLTVASKESPMEQNRFPNGCRDAGGSVITGFVWDRAKNASESFLLESSTCNSFSKRRSSSAAQELSQWVRHLRGQPLATRVPPMRPNFR